MITIGFASGLALLMFFWTWTIPIIIPPIIDPGIMVELNLPDEPAVFAKEAGGGGGGNPVRAIGEKGTAHAPPQPGTKDDAKDIEEDETEKSTPPILRPDNPKPTATKINENKSVVKTEPKPNPLPPAPPKPKAVLGKTTGGNSTGGGAAEDYDKAGGAGNGSGVGRDNGNGGGSGPGSARASRRGRARRAASRRTRAPSRPPRTPPC